MTTYVLRYDETGKAHLIEKHLAPPKDSHSRSPFVLNDIAPFKSIVDGSVVGSRSQLRDHNRRNKVIDVGNDPALYRPAPANRPYEPQGVEMDVKRAMKQCGIEY